MHSDTLYTERYRPQFHFTAREGWLNDPNGCVFHDGEWHLFFQHNPAGLVRGNRAWGHGVSTDLVHWRQLPHAILPYGGGTIYSGSAVVDSDNTAGFGDGCVPPLVAAFTHATKPSGQSIAFSTDRGRTWDLYAGGKHVVPNQGLDAAERDPRIFWHDPSRKWVMVLWVRKNQARFLVSGDLKQWTVVGDFTGEGFYECPDMFELPVDGNRQDMKWVLHDAAFNYWIGSFDGKAFIPESGPMRGDLGRNFYAAQTWNNTGPRVVQIGWMSGGEYPGMLFDQQMSFPCELALRKTFQGIRLCRTPVAEIERLRVGCDSVSDRTLPPGAELCAGKSGNLFDIEAEVEISPGASFMMRLYDQNITYANERVRCLGKEAVLLPVGNRVSLRILVDRTSIELFGNDGEVCMSSCFLPPEKDTVIQCHAASGTVRIRSLAVHRLASAWSLPLSG